jgi:hypothetical protein
MWLESPLVTIFRSREASVKEVVWLNILLFCYTIGAAIFVMTYSYYLGHGLRMIAVTLALMVPTWARYWKTTNKVRYVGIIIATIVVVNLASWLILRAL